MIARSWLGVWCAGVLLVACGPSITPPPEHADVTRVATQYPNTTLEELEQGRRVYLSRCTSCHAPIAPGAIPPERWPGEVAEMSERARLGTDEQLVVKYLVAQSLRNPL